MEQKNRAVAQDLKDYRNMHSEDHHVIVNCAIRNLKNQNNLGQFTAQQISENLRKALNEQFTGDDKVEVIKVEFPDLDDQTIADVDPLYNNINDCQFLKEVLQAECLSGLENTSPELDQTFRMDNDEQDETFEFKTQTKEELINQFLKQLKNLYFSGNSFTYIKIIKDMKESLNSDKALDSREDKVLNVLLKFKLKLLNVLPNFSFKIQSQSQNLFLNFQAAKLLNENSQTMKEFNVKMGKKMVLMKTFDFGSLFEKYKAENETLHQKEQQSDINYKFSSYFDYQNLAQKIPNDISLVMYYHKEESQFSKYLEVVISFYNKLLLKIQIEFTYCQFAILQENDTENILYLKMISPPLFQISIYKNRKYEMYNLKKDWMRVHNIFSHFNIEYKRISEIQRLMLINNTTIKLVFDKNIQTQEQNLTFQGLIEKLNQFQLMFHDSEKLTIKITSVNIDQQSEYEEVQNLMKKLPFGCYFNICSIVSTNRLFLPDSLKKLINRLLRELQESKKNNFEQIQEATFQQFYKLSDNANIYFHLKKFHNHNLLLFNKILKTASEDIVEGEINKQLAYIFRLSLTPSGFIFQFKMPEETSKVLRDYYDSSQYFIRLHFEDENQESLRGNTFISKNYFRDQLISGVQIFNRRYSLLTWSASQLRSGSCWLFDSVTSNISRTQIIESVGYFQDKLKLDQVAKNAARLGQPFSASSPFQFKSPVNVEVIEDKFDPSGKAYTDGIGGISEDLIEEIRKYHNRPFESALQIRYHGAKGVLALNKNLPNRTIHLRKSMIKFDPSLQQNSTYGQELSIIEYNKFRGGYLNRQLIILLSTLGIPDEVFIELQDEYIKSIQTVLAIDSSIYKHINVDYDQEQYGIPNIANLLRKMMNAGLTDQNNLFIKNVYDRLKERGLLQLRMKCNILVEKAARLLGVIDEYDLLNEDEVFAIYAPSTDDKPRIVTSKTGYVIVSRNPCLHPGDIRKLAIVSDEEIKRRNQGKNPYFPDMVNCVIFPTQGLAITAQCGGGDLDGDQYFISWDDRMMIEKHCEPMVYDEDTKKKQKKVEERADFTEEYFQTDRMLDFLFQYLDSDVLGKIDNSHLAIADKSPYKANDEKCKQLAILHAKAVDYVKHGERVTVPQDLVAKEWPDFMEKENKIIQYESEGVLGKLYRLVKEITNSLTHIDNILQLGYKNPKLPPIDQELIYQYTTLCKDFEDKVNQNSQSMDQHISQSIDQHNSQTMDPHNDNSESVEQNQQQSLVSQKDQEEYMKVIKEIYNEQVIEIAIKCLNYIFEQIDSLRKMYDIKNEYEIYSGYYTNFTKGEGTRLKKKLNIDNIQKQVLQYIVILKRKVNLKIGENKSQRLAIISLMHLILSYSPYSNQINTQYVKGQVIQILIKDIERYQLMLFQRLQIKFSTWYRGCTWFLFNDELLEIKKTNIQSIHSIQQNNQQQDQSELEEL